MMPQPLPAPGATNPALHLVQPPQWKSRLLLNSDDQAESNLANALLYLEHDPRLSGLYRFNEFTQANERKNDQGNFQPLHDHDITALRTYLQRADLPRLTKSDTRDALVAFARKHSYHPVREHLEALPPWDGVQRLNGWLAAYLGAPDNPCNAEIGLRFMIAMIARITRPGCKHDHVLVLEGPQGKGKSTACRILAGQNAWFSDSLPNLQFNGGKEASQALRGIWLCEVAELSGFKGTEAAALKAFISRQIEKYRPPHAEFETIEPRQCVFIATTNESAYLNDPTGGRRFWPVEVCKTGPLNLDALAQDRPQLFAEALARYNAGEPWHPNPKFEEEFLRPVQSERQEIDPWAEKIEPFLAGRDQVTVGQIAEECLFLSSAQTGKREQMRIGSTLQALGWEQRRTKSARFYVPKACEAGR